MAVTKIRKISSWTLMAIMGISLAVLALFFLGGVTPESNADWKEYNFTSELLYWMYIVLVLAVIALFAFAIQQFVTSLIANPKSALASLSVVVVFVAIFGITYAVGDATPIASITNADFAKFQVPFWLKLTDMWIYTMYILFVLCIVALFATQFRKVFSK